MNSCQRAERLIDYLLKQLTEEEKKEFEAHLKSCELCRQELQLERVIESELSEELQPGFIENRIRAQLQVRQARDIRSLWMYVFRMVVYGVTAAIVSITMVPFLLRLPLISSIDLSKYTSEAAELLGQIAPVNTFLIIFGICYVAVFLASMYSLSQIRR
jgi:anti-sigma factor RsiW